MKIITEEMRFRKRLCEFALKYGVTKAAKRYHTNRQFVYRQLEKYDGTLRSLALQSRKPHSHPNAHTKEDLIKIIEEINLKVNKQINETIGVPPIMLFQKEKEYLKPLPNNKILNSYLYDTISVKVSNESLFYYKGSKYSVPIKFINHTLSLREESNKLYIYYNKDLITIHDISDKYINYKEEHYNEGFMNILKNKTQDEINNIARRNLELINKLSEV